MAFQYLSKYVLAKLNSEPSCIERLLTSLIPSNRWNQKADKQKDAHLKLIVALKCLDLFSEQSRDFSNLLAGALAERINDKGEFKELLCEFERQDDSIRTCAFVVDVFKRRQTWLESKLAVGPPVFSWKMSQAIMPDHPQVEAFLRSDQLEFKYQFNRVAYLRRFISSYSNEWNNKNGGYSANMKELADKICLITKTKNMYDRQMTEFNAKTQELSNIKKFLASI